MTAYGSQKKIERGLRDAFGKVREELDGHLDSINENTAEIQSVYEYLMGLETKLDKLAERLDEQSLGRQYAVEPLSLREQEVFLLLYAASLPVGLSAIADRLGLTDTRVVALVNSLVSKGVPVLQEIRDRTVFFSMELRFKDVQAKRDVVPLDSRLSVQLFERD